MTTSENHVTPQPKLRPQPHELKIPFHNSSTSSFPLQHTSSPSNTKAAKMFSLRNVPSSFKSSITKTMRKTWTTTLRRKQSPVHESSPTSSSPESISAEDPSWKVSHFEASLISKPESTTTSTISASALTLQLSDMGPVWSTENIMQELEGAIDRIRG
ncbi:hypothetical protein K470DRAFT_286244 [Piedraia hortae CBS 480.64]|uniref:Uncharacterized protein n=1 Tax=Piedraia hortae CBS 480.64 TaxID=1314780 RepID=A0A6A7C1H2_9PEZI|nr:hypothetical protein K470DRAFT_286244 [Piedraia hortae CBS 480.64]